MRLKEFFQRLPKDGWEFLVGDTIIRNYSRGKCECPITASCDTPRADHWVAVAAQELGLSRDLSSRIIDAADGKTLWRPTIRRIRRLLLSHCNLSEPAGEGRGN